MAPKQCAEKPKPVSEPKAEKGPLQGRSWKRGKKMLFEKTTNGETIRKWVDKAVDKEDSSSLSPTQLLRARNRAAKTLKSMSDEDLLTSLEERLMCSSLLREASIQCLILHPDLFTPEQLTKVVVGSNIAPLQMFAGCASTDSNFIKKVVKSLVDTKVMKEEDVSELFDYARKRYASSDVSSVKTSMVRSLLCEKFGAEDFLEYAAPKSEG